MENKLSRLIERVSNYYWIEERKKKIKQEVREREGRRREREKGSSLVEKE